MFSRELHRRGLIIKFVSDALRYLLEVHECLVLGIGGQIVRESDEYTDCQGRCQTQHIEQYLVAGVQREWLNYLGRLSTFYLVPDCQLILARVGFPRLDQRDIVGAFHHIFFSNIYLIL